MTTAVAEKKWVGRSVKRHEDPRLLTGRGKFVDDLTLPHVHHLAILRSPHPHARLRRVDVAEALRAPGVAAVLTGEDVAARCRPFSAAISTPVKYFCMAVDTVRYVGEPIAAVVARDRYAAEDALDLIRVEYEELPAVVDQEEAMRPGAPVIHEGVPNNAANHRVMRYGDVDAAFAGADLVVSERFVFHRYSSTPMECYAIAALHDPAEDVLTIWSNFHGPFILHPVVGMAIGVPENRLRFIIPPDIGGSFGTKCGIFPYLALVGLAALKAPGRTVKWIEDRRENLTASCSGADRVAYLDAAVQRDGTVRGLRSRWVDNNGAYIRAPEPANLYRTLGNMVGPYRFRNMELDATAVLTNKAPTGPNRGYGCQQLYFGMERLMDLVAGRLGMDPAELRRRNLIQPDQFPYANPTGGLYDAGDYPATLRMALEMAGYDALREDQRRARAEGRLFGIGIALAVDPSVSNMAYVTVAFDESERHKPGYLPKAGAGETGTVKMDPLGKVIVQLNTAPEGHGHETVVAQIVADELGIHPDDVRVVAEMDTFTRVWSISTGTYSSRFASVATTAFATAARRLRRKILAIGAHLLEARVEDMDLADGRVLVKGSPARSMDLKHVAGVAHWNPPGLPPGMEPGLQETYMFNFPTAKEPDGDRVDSSNTYGFIAEVVAVEIAPETGEIRFRRYVSAHDAGTILNPMLVDGQIQGGVLHGVGGAIFEEMSYGAEGQFLAASFMDYLCPTAAESVPVEIGHTAIPSPFTALGSKGCGESSSMTAPAAIANAVADALAPLGVQVKELPLTPERVWRLIRDARAAKSTSREATAP